MRKSLPGIAQLNTDLADLLREGRFESLLLLDVDQFHQLNAEFGVKVGDRVLTLVEKVLHQHAEQPYRIGGDQYALYNIDKAKGEELRHAVALAAKRELRTSATLSGGGVQVDAGLLVAGAESIRALYGAASQLLALAKSRGRDRIVWISPSGESEEGGSAVAERLYRELAWVNAGTARKMEVESRVDALTGLYNRRGFDDLFGRLVDVAQRTHQAIGLIYIDSDTLKKINDAHGHEAGDRFIVDVASVMRTVARQSDFIFRWGADEFAIILENSEESSAVALAERVRKAIAARTAGTVSVGIYCGVPGDPAEAVRAADAAMYAAKESGKNRVVVGPGDRRQSLPKGSPGKKRAPSHRTKSK